MHDVQGLGGATVRGRGGTALRGVSASHVCQRHQPVQSGSGGGRAYPYPLRWRHACRVLLVVVIDQGAGQMAADNLCVWQRSGELANRDALQAHQWNGGVVTCEGMRGPDDSRFGLREIDGACVMGVLMMATVAAVVLAGARG